MSKPPRLGNSETCSAGYSQAVQRADLHGFKPLDEGGEGSVFVCDAPVGDQALSSARTVVYKEYKETKRASIDAEALGQLVRLPVELESEDTALLSSLAAWPTHSVLTEGVSVGVLMPHVPATYYLRTERTDGSVETILAKFELLLNGDDFLRRMGIHLTDLDRLELLSSVAATLDFFHQRDIVVGDFSCRNLLFSVGPPASCYFIDCDSMQLHGRSTLPIGETPEWELPSGEEVGTPEGDVYKFSLLVLRLFTGAQHHRDPRRLPRRVPISLRTLVQRGLSTDSALRPSMRTWCRVLAPAREDVAARLVRQATGPALPSPAPSATKADSPLVLPSIVAWRCRYDFMLNGTEICQRCHRHWTAAALPASPQVRGPNRKTGAGDGRATSAPGNKTGTRIPAAHRAPVRRFRSPSLKRIALMMAGVWAACFATFYLVALMAHSQSHFLQLLARVLHTALPVVFIVYAALGLYLALTEVLR